jgi:hypothetical protein
MPFYYARSGQCTKSGIKVSEKVDHSILGPGTVSVELAAVDSQIDAE